MSNIVHIDRNPSLPNIEVDSREASQGVLAAGSSLFTHVFLAFYLALKEIIHARLFQQLIQLLVIG